MSDTRQDEGERVHTTKAATTDDFFSGVLAKPNVTNNMISSSREPMPRRSLRWTHSASRAPASTTRRGAGTRRTRTRVLPRSKVHRTYSDGDRISSRFTIVTNLARPLIAWWPQSIHIYNHYIYKSCSQARVLFTITMDATITSFSTDVLTQAVHRAY